MRHSLLALVLLLGCEGDIGQVGGPELVPPIDVTPENCSPPETGTPVRRLNRYEIAYALSDVFGADADAFLGLPRDGTVGGFPTVGSQLSAGTLFTEGFISTAEMLAERWVRDGTVSIVCEAGTGTCVSEGLADEARLLFRRAPDAAELASLDALAATIAAELGPEDALIASVTALITSPAFLFVTLQEATDGPRARNPHELASRFALALWSSVPDDALLAAAEDGSLSEQRVQQEHIERMINHERFERFSDRFVDSWLTFERLDNSGVDPAAFGLDEPTWDVLIEDMKEETRRFIAHILTEDRPISELFSADYTFVNARLAEHYGLEANLGEEFERVELDEASDRQGLLTHGAVLSQATSGDEVSVVIRGEAILAGFLCQPPPAPPESVLDTIEEILDADPSEREKMAIRAEDPNCAGCHASLDPVGWAFSGFDGVAAPVTIDEEGLAPDPSGVFDRQVYDGARDMSGLLAERDRYADCFVEKLLIHTLGRRVTPDTSFEDACTVRSIVDGARADGASSIRQLLRRTVLSPAFGIEAPIPDSSTMGGE